MGYRMMGKLFLLCYLKLLSFSDFPQSTLFLIRKTSLACQLLEKQKMTRVSTWQGRSGRLKTKWESRLVMQDEERKLGLPAGGWLGSMLLHIRWFFSVH